MNTLPKINNFNLIRLFFAVVCMYHHARFMNMVEPYNGFMFVMMGLFPPVPVFFAISGFLITKSYIENGGNVKHYMVNRVLRLYPPLWVNLSVALVLLFINGGVKSGSVFSIKFMAWNFFQFLLGVRCFFANTLFDLTTYCRLFPSEYLWTVPIELGFYVLVPMIYYSLAREKKNSKWFYMVLAGFVVSMYFAVLNSQFSEQIIQKILLDDSYVASNILKLSTLPYLWFFLFSSFVYIKWNRVEKYLKNKFWIWMLIYIVFRVLRLDHKGLNFMLFITDWTDVVSYLLMTLCVLSFAYSFPSLRFLNRKVDLSYGIYLNHMQIITLVLYLGFKQSHYFLGLVFAGTFAVAMASWILIEKPAFKLKDSWLGDTRRTSNVPPDEMFLVGPEESGFAR